MNSKVVVLLISVLTIVLFVGLGYYGWTHRYGAEELYEVNEPQRLRVVLNPQALTLSPEDLFDGLWNDVPSLQVQLFAQVTERPWPQGVTRAVTVQAFHNDTDIYFRMSWEDDAQDIALAVDSFSDGCAVAIPLDSSAPQRSIMMGFSSPVNIWHWQAHKDRRFWEDRHVIPDATEADYTYPFENQETLPVSSPQLASAVCDLLAQRAGSLTAKDDQRVQGRGHWEAGTWTVVFRRALRTQNTEQDSQFATQHNLSSFAVWDGDQTDRGARKSISEWVILDVEQKTTESVAVMTTDRAEDISNPPPAFRSKRRFSWLSTVNAQGVDAPAQTSPVDQEPRVINITAKRFEYTPHRVEVRKGEHITLRMESLDVTHGLYLDAYGIKIKARPGVIGKATFVADKAGRFSFRCSETCGEFHPYMLGHFNVSPNSRFRLFFWAVCGVFVVIMSIVWRKARHPEGVDNNG